MFFPEGRLGLSFVSTSSKGKSPADRSGEQMLLCTLTVTVAAAVMRSSLAFTRSDEHLNSAKLSLWLISICQRGCEPVKNAPKKTKLSKVRKQPE